MNTPLDKKVAVVFTGALVFGLYCSTFLVVLRWLLWADEGWRVRKNIRWPIVIVASLIFGCNAFHISWILYWNMVAVWHAANDPPGTPAYKTPEYVTVVSCAVSDFPFLLADFVLIARCWIVYGRRNLLVIIPPVFLWLVALLCMVLQIYLQVAHIHNPEIGPYSWAEVNMITGPGIVMMPFWISTNLLNAYVAGALIYRIHRTAKRCKSVTSIEHLHFVIRLITESGVLYFPITLAHLFLWFWTNSFALDIANTLNAPLLGVAFNWFIIGAARNRVAGTTKDTSEDISTIKFRRPCVHGESIVTVTGYASDSASAQMAIGEVNKTGPVSLR